MKIKYLFFLLFTIHFSLFTFNCFSQNKAHVYGKVTDSDGKPLETVNISIFNSQLGTVTDKKGNYLLEAPANKKITIVYFEYILELI